MTMTEQQVQLVVAAQGGDIASFEQLFSIYRDKVYGFARMLLRNDNDAEDVLQEAFITAWQKLSTLKAAPTFSVWIQVIARNLCNMQLRRKDQAILLDAEQDIAEFEATESDELLPQAYAEQADLRERLGRVIDSLSDVQRQAIVLYYFNELSIDEIAEVMECSPGTVKSRLYLARKAIKSEVEEQERRSGQSFYGAALLPLGALIRAHVETFVLSQTASGTALAAIARGIAETGGSVEQVAQVKAGSVPAEKATGLSLRAKVAAGVASVAALGLVGLLIWTLSGSGSALTAGGESSADDLPTAVQTDPAGQVDQAGGSDDSPGVQDESPIGVETSEAESDQQTSAAGSETQGGSLTTTFFATVTLDANRRAGRNSLPILVDDMVVVYISDTELVERYGLDFSDGGVYRFGNEVEQWVPYTITPDTEILLIYEPFTSGNYDRLSMDEFYDYLTGQRGSRYMSGLGYMRANVTIGSDGRVLRIVQVYFP